MALQDFYTFVKDLRPFGQGTPIAYRYQASAFAADALGDLVSGEFAAYDATNRRVVRFVRNGGAGQFIGITRDSAQGRKTLGDQAALDLIDMSVFTSGVHSLTGIAGDIYSHGDAVFMSGTNTQVVTKTQGAGGVQLGAVFSPDGTQFNGAVRVPILIDSFAKLGS